MGSFLRMSYLKEDEEDHPSKADIDTMEAKYDFCGITENYIYMNHDIPMQKLNVSKDDFPHTIEVS